MNDPRVNAAITSTMKASYDVIPLAKIDLSATPMQKLRRERFDKPALKELAESVKEHGVLQPILLRRHNGANFELVAGERRYLASKAAGLASIPAIARDLTDLQVIEMQVIENNQREDLHKLIEAEGFEQLMKVHKLNADDIAAKIGKSRSYVYGVLKYTDLCPEARRAFYDGKLNPSTALLVARIGHHDTQRAALKDLTEGAPRYHGGPREGEPMSYRDAHKHVLATYTLNLKSAPFDVNDANLVAKAGACTGCPKRTGNQKELFGDVKSGDVCTDPVCFDGKRQALHAFARCKLEAEGKTVIHGAEAKKLIPHWEDRPGSYHHDHLTGGYEKLDATTYASGRGMKVSELIGDREPVLIQHPLTGKIIQAASPQQLAAAAKARNAAKDKRSSATPRPPKPEGPSIDDLVVRKAFEQLGAKIPAKVTTAALRDIALYQLDKSWDMEYIAVALGLPPTATQTAVEKLIKKMKDGELVRALALIQLAECAEGGDLDEIEGDLEARKIDPKKLRADIESEQKAKAAAAKAKTKPAAKAKKK